MSCTPRAPRRVHRGRHLVVAASVLILWPHAPSHAQADLERRILDLERRVVPYDGRVQEVEGTEVTVSLDGDVLFELDKAELTPAAQAALTELAAQLDDSATGAVSVVGHTDALGTDEYNIDLSNRRAQNVRDFLAAAVEEDFEFRVDGRGEAEPVAPNTTPNGSDDPEGRRRNRRVEVTFTGILDE